MSVVAELPPTSRKRRVDVEHAEPELRALDEDQLAKVVSSVVERTVASLVGKKQKRGKKWVVQGEWEWDSTQEFIIERLLDKMVADGSTEVPGRAGIKAGTVLYKVLWEGWPEELATWEDEEDIPCGEVDFVGQYESVLDAAASGESGPDGSDDERVNRNVGLV